MGCKGSKSDVITEISIPPPATAPATTEPVKYGPIHSAIRWNKPVEEVRALLVSDEAVNCADPGNGNRPIHIAAQNGHTEIVKLLIERNANVNAQNLKGNTALHMSIGYDIYEVSKLLLDAGADDKIVNADGNPASRGIDGKKTLGISALVCAQTRADAEYAISLCEAKVGELSKEELVQAGLKARKNLNESWTDDLKDRLRDLMRQIP